MILLDTHVLSEVMKPGPDANVLAWFDRQVAETVFVSTITVAELQFGIALLPKGSRKVGLTAVVDGLLLLFQDRMLPFDLDAASRYADLAALARKKGKGFPTPDGYIAGIAASRGFMVASRDTAPFAAGGVPVVDPWVPGA